MLAKRIIPCLDVKSGMVVKGIRFRDHEVLGDVKEFARYYKDCGADELVFYDITASSEDRLVDRKWISEVAELLDIPFCVAGGIRSIEDTQRVLNAGADKISINSPALENPQLIWELSQRFGSQCVVVGVDSYELDGDYFVYQYTGDPQKTRPTFRRTIDWVQEVQQLGAGEIVINAMNQDGVKNGYDIRQLKELRKIIHTPLVASGGAGCLEHFSDVFNAAHVEGALAASVFHKKQINIKELKQYLQLNKIEVRL